MPEQSALLKIECKSEDVHVIDFCDNVVRPHHLSLLDNELTTLIDRLDEPMIVIDFTSVEYFPSTGLGVLIAARQRIIKKDGQIRLAHLSSLVKNLFQISGLDRVFIVHEDIDGAIAAFF
jgi:anti-sigma B factor antagonist